MMVAMTCQDWVAYFARFWEEKEGCEGQDGGGLREGGGRTKLLWPDIVTAGPRGSVLARKARKNSRTDFPREESKGVWSASPRINRKRWSVQARVQCSRRPVRQPI